MADPVSFDSYEAARAAMELGEITFRCNVCRRNHRSGSLNAASCGQKAYSSFPAYRFSIGNKELRIILGLSSPYPWRCWGREKALVEYAAAFLRVEEALSAVRKGFKWKGRWEALAAVTKDTYKNMTKEFLEEFRSMVDNAVAEAQTAAGEAASSAKELFIPGPPALPLPVMVDKEHMIDGESKEMRYDRFVNSLVETVKDGLQAYDCVPHALSSGFFSSIKDMVSVFVFSGEIAPGFYWEYTYPLGFRFEEHGMYVLLHGGDIILTNRSRCGANEKHYSLLYVEDYCMPRAVKHFWGSIDVKQVLAEARALDFRREG